MESKWTTRGVYCVDIEIKAVPISMNSKLPKVKKTLENIPIALDDNLKPLHKRFLNKIIKLENINKYRLNYNIIIKKYLSGLCYDINK